jgi:hypothetical protein
MSNYKPTKCITNKMDNFLNIYNLLKDRNLRKYKNLNRPTMSKEVELIYKCSIKEEHRK